MSDYNRHDCPRCDCANPRPAVASEGIEGDEFRDLHERAIRAHILGAGDKAHTCDDLCSDAIIDRLVGKTPSNEYPLQPQYAVASEGLRAALEAWVGWWESGIGNGPPTHLYEQARAALAAAPERVDPARHIGMDTDWETTWQRADVLWSLLCQHLDAKQIEDIAAGIYEPLLAGLAALRPERAALDVERLARALWDASTRADEYGPWIDQPTDAGKETREYAAAIAAAYDAERQGEQP